MQRSDRPGNERAPRPTERLRQIAAAALLLAAILGSSPALGQGLFDRVAPSGAGFDSSEVKTRLLADTTAIEPGKPFRLGVLFEVQSDWHIYWRYSGEVGMPTQVEWTLPEGFTAGELQWPQPEPIDDPATGLKSYGWENEVLLFATVTPPENLTPGAALTFGAESSWLACKVQCVPGDSSESLSLPVGSAAASDDAALFDRFADQVPEPATRESLPFRLTFSPPEALIAPGANLEQLVMIHAIDPWRLQLANAAGRSVMIPDATIKLVSSGTEVAETSGAEEYSEGEMSYASIAFGWNLSARESAEPGEVTLRPTLTLALVNPDSGEQKLFRVFADRTVTLEPAAGGPPVVSSSAVTPPPAASSEVKQPGVEGTAAAAAVRPEGDDGFNFQIGKNEKPQSLAFYLLLAFLGGLLLNVMPCVLPVLSIKILGFVNQAREDPRRILRSGLLFAAGVYVSFLALALLVIAVKAAGSQIGWGFQLQEPRFVVLISAAIFAFGLSLFGVFTFELPGSAASGMQNVASRKGAAGDFMNGVLATLLATPCTAPLLGPALGFAFSQPPAAIVGFFGVIATGLAAPYVLLSARPGWLRFMPRPGPWMERFKQAMGVLLMATVIWLLWVLGKQTGSDGIIATLSFLLAVGIACAVIGWGFDLSATSARRTTGILLAAVLILAGYFLFPERLIRRIAAAPINAESLVAPANSGPGEKGGIDWKPFSIEAVNALTSQNKTVFVDFTADWCLTCKVNETTVLSTDAVQGAFREHGVEALFADYTRRDPGITKILHDFGRAGVPMYIIFPAGRPEDYILLPEVLTSSLVIEKLREASQPLKVADSASP